MLSYRILHNSDRFDIRLYWIPLVAIAGDGGCLLWELDGCVGKISNANLREQIRLLSAYEKMQQRGRIVDLPAAAYELTWDQTIEHRPASGEKLTQPLRLDVVERKGKGGDDTGVPH